MALWMRSFRHRGVRDGPIGLSNRRRSFLGRDRFQSSLSGHVALTNGLKTTRNQHICLPLAEVRAFSAVPSKSSVCPDYGRLASNLTKVRRVLGPHAKLSLAEKILYAHALDIEATFADGSVRGSKYLKLQPDRVAMQDASAQMALLQFMTCGMHSTAVPASIHCDHLIVGRTGGEDDIRRSIEANEEVYRFLQSAARRYGITFWGPGSGIIHQIVLENYAVPGLLMLGTDSHTPNAGGLGAVAIGVGGSDAVDALTGTPWELKAPNILGIKLSGCLGPWASAKDLILHLTGRLSVRGGTGYVLEYFGPAVDGLSATGSATICNMGAEAGATTSIVLSRKCADYLRATGRGESADYFDRYCGLLSADEGVEYDQVIEVDLSSVEPHLNGPFTPDLATPISTMKQKRLENNWPEYVSSALIGSCTNSSYEDMRRVASIVEQAAAAGLELKMPLLVTPGSEQIRATLKREGILQTLVDAGATVLANACGPCIGQWDRPATEKKETNAILTSFNRNFRGRNDGSANTMNFLASPEVVTAMAFAGRLDFDPQSDSLEGPLGEPFRFAPPKGIPLPMEGFAATESFKPEANAVPDGSIAVEVAQGSERLAELKPFDRFSGEELMAKVLVKVAGKCTTDHISAAGPWLKYKGHLENICHNTLIGATNAETGNVNEVYDSAKNKMVSIPELMFAWKAAGVSWAIIGEYNYGEGSAREHAALQPRYLGGRMVLVKSFARIHETNLKKQGLLPLTFADAADYQRIRSGDTLRTVGLGELLRKGEGELSLAVEQEGARFEVPVKHTLSRDQVEWFKAGSALNFIAAALAPEL